MSLLEYFPAFSFYDWLLIVCVALFGTVSSWVKDPQVKAVFATVPVPFALAWLAVGLPVGAPNAVGAFLVLAYVHVVRKLHNQMRVPIVLAIALGIAVYAGSGAILAHRLPTSEHFFIGMSVLVSGVGAILLWTQNYADGVHYRTSLHPLPKFAAIFSVVWGLALVKHLLLGFTPFFPMMNSITSYEARHSLWTQCRQIPLFMFAAGPMLTVMRYTELAGLARGWVLTLGVVVYMALFIPGNQWLRAQIKASVA